MGYSAWGPKESDMTGQLGMHEPAPSHPGRWSEKLFCSLDFYVLCLLIDRLKYSIFDKYFTEGSFENVPMYHIRRHTMIVPFLDGTEFDPSFEVVLTSFLFVFSV